MIGIVTTWFERGAAYVSRQYRDVLRQRTPVRIYVRGGERRPVGDPAWDDDGVTWGRAPIHPLQDAVHLGDFRRWLEKERIDTVLFSEQRWFLPVLACSEMGRKVGAYVLHYTEETAAFFGCYDYLICNLRRHYKVFADWHPQVAYIPWGTDLRVFRPGREVRSRPGSLVFVHSAGMNPRRKGTDLVLRAFEGVQGDARLRVHSQIPLSESLDGASLALAARLEAAGRLSVIVRTEPNPAALYEGADVYVYPARHDGLGLSIPEALACGVPVITVDAGPANELADPSCARFVPVAAQIARPDGDYWPQVVADVDALAAAMRCFVEAAEDIPNWKRRARAFAERRLDWALNAGELGALMESFQLVDSPTKQHAAALVREREGQIRREGLQYWLAETAPLVLAGYRGARRLLTGRKAASLS